MYLPYAKTKIRIASCINPKDLGIVCPIYTSSAIASVIIIIKKDITEKPNEYIPTLPIIVPTLLAWNPYDKERYEQLREIAAQMLSYKTDIPIDKVKKLFCNEEGYQTPKLDTRAAIFNDDKILLVHERNGKWSLPGGWVDVLESIESNTIKEVKEEAGLDVTTKKIIAIQDRNKHNTPIYPYGVCKVFVECEVISGGFVPNIETTEIEYFSLDNLPEISEEKNNIDQITMCFKSRENENWKVLFD